MTDPEGAHDSGDGEHGPLFWTGLVVGGALMALGARGILTELEPPAIRDWVLVFFGSDIVHDAVVAPLVLLVGVAVARFVPRPVRPAVQAGLFLSAMVLAVVLVPLRDWGGNPGNPTIRPLDYTSATLTALALVWAGVVVVTAGVALWRRRPAQVAGEQSTRR